MARTSTPRAAPRKRKSNELIVSLDEFAALCGVTPETMRNHLKQAPAEADWLLARGRRGVGYKIAAEAALAWYRQRGAGGGTDTARQAQLAELRLQMLGDAGDDDGLLLTGKQRYEEYRAGEAGGNVEVVNDLLLGDGHIISRSSTHMLVHGTGFGSANQFIEWFGPIKSSLAECTEAQAIRYTKTDGTAYSAGIVAEGQLRNQKTNFDYGLTSVAIGPFVTNGKTRKFVVSMSYDASGTRWSAYRDEGAVTASFVLERLRPDGGWDQLGNGQLGNYVYDDGGNGGIANEFEPARYSKSASGTIEITDTSGGTDPIQLRARITAFNAPGVTGTARQPDVISQVLQVVSYEP
jgi:hypothetical protein